jgi:hypothetical protein
MSPQHPRRISSAHVLALLSLFVAMSGWAYAASVEKNSVSSKSVKNNSLKGKDVKDDSLTSADVDESTLDGIEGAVGPQGPQGPQGTQGPQGIQGPPGPATGQAGGVLTGSYPDPGLGVGVVGGTNLAASLADVLDENDIATAGVAGLEIAPDSVNKSEIVTDGVGTAEIDDNNVHTEDVGLDQLTAVDIASNAIGAAELDAVFLRTQSVAVPGGGTAQNGNMDTRGVTASCETDELAISGGGHWSPSAADDEELYLVESRPVGAGTWFVRGGNDSGAARTLVADVLCLAPGN